MWVRSSTVLPFALRSAIGTAPSALTVKSAQDGQLLTEHQDLGILDEGVHTVDPNKLDDAVNQAVEEAQRHRTGASRRSSPLVKLAIE